MNVSGSSCDPDIGSALGRPRVVLNGTLVMVHAALFACFSVLTGVAGPSAPVLTFYIRRLTDSDFVCSLVPVIWGVAGMTTLAASYLSEKFRQDRRLAIVFITMAGVIGMVAGLMPLFFNGQGTPAVIGLMGTMFVANVLCNVYMVAYFAWLPDLVGDRVVGRVFAGIGLTSAFAVGVTQPLCGRYLDANPDTGFPVLFVVGGVFGVASALPLIFARGAKRPHPPQEAFLRGTLKLLANSNVLRALLIIFLVDSSGMFTGAFENVFFKETLNLSYETVGFVFMTLAVAACVMKLAWGRVADKHGARIIVLIGATGAALRPAILSVCTSEHTALVFPAQALGGMLYSAYMVGWLLLTYAVTPANKRAAAVGLVWIFNSFGGIVAPLLGGRVVQAFGGYTFEIAGRTFGGTNVLLLLQALIATSAVFMCFSLKLSRETLPHHALLLFAQNPVRALWQAFYGDHVVRFIRSKQGKQKSRDSGSPPPS